MQPVLRWLQGIQRQTKGWGSRTCVRPDLKLAHRRLQSLMPFQVYFSQTQTSIQQTLLGILSSPIGHETHLGLSSGDRYTQCCKASICPPVGGRDAEGGLGSHSHLQLLLLSRLDKEAPVGGIPGESGKEKEAIGGRAEEMSLTKREDSAQEPT